MAVQSRIHVNLDQRWATGEKPHKTRWEVLTDDGSPNRDGGTDPGQKHIGDEAPSDPWGDRTLKGFRELMLAEFP